VPAPEIVQAYELIAAGPVKVVVELAQTAVVAAGLIEQLGSALTVTCFVQTGLLTQPFVSVVVRVRVKIPVTEPAVTLTDCEVVEPTIVPFVPTDQL
jgi:hypothetical protein